MHDVCTLKALSSTAEQLDTVLSFPASGVAAGALPAAAQIAVHKTWVFTIAMASDLDDTQRIASA